MKGESIADAVLVMTAEDTVGTAIEDLEAGRSFEYGGREITVAEDVPFGHKVALEPIEEGETVVKYGESIGAASADIAPGEWVHTHNCESNRGRGDVEGARA